MDWKTESASSNNPQHSVQLDPTSQLRQVARHDSNRDKARKDCIVVEFGAARQQRIEAFFRRFPDAFTYTLLEATIAEFGPPT